GLLVRDRLHVQHHHRGRGGQRWDRAVVSVAAPPAVDGPDQARACGQPHGRRGLPDGGVLMARGGWRATIGALTLLPALWAAGHVVMGCDRIAGIIILNSDELLDGGAGGRSSSGGSKDAAACSPEALSCSACASCDEVVEVFLDDFGAQTSPEGPLT